MYPSGKLEAYPTSMTSMPAANNPGANGGDEKYIVTTKILVLALAVLFAVVFFVICLHIYAKWAWSTRAPESFYYSFWPSRWRRSRDSPILLDAEMLDSNMVVGLNKAAVEALPTFKYKADIEMGALECAICLGQFQEDELGRTLPKCNHRFHLECIDMWLYSHSTCPLCRDVLEPEEVDPVSLNMVESASVQVFRNERMSTQRRLRGMEPGDQHMLQDRDEREELEDEDPHEQETGNKRADAIPANVLFWGNLMQQQGAEFRVVNNAPTTGAVANRHRQRQRKPKNAKSSRCCGSQRRFTCRGFSLTPPLELHHQLQRTPPVNFDIAALGRSSLAIAISNSNQHRQLHCKVVSIASCKSTDIAALAKSSLAIASCNPT